jgi:hypothetical protein
MDLNDALNARFVALERQVRTLRALAGGLAVGLLLAMTMNTPLAQGKTLPERVDDLEKRVVSLFGENVGGKTRFKAPFEVTNAEGKRVFGVDEDATVLVGDRDGAHVMLKPPSATGGGGIGISGPAASIKLGVEPGRGTGLYLREPGTGTMLAHLALPEQTKRPALSLGKSDAGGIYLNVDAAGRGHAQFHRADGSVFLTLGRTDADDSQFGVSLWSESKKLVGGFFTSPNGGSLKVMDADGAIVGGLLSEPTGGAIALLQHGGGTNNAVELNIRNGGGNIKVFGVSGGTARAGMFATEAEGALVAYNTASNPVAILASRPSGAGRLQLSMGPTTIVEAGVNGNGVGVVRAGPNFGGPVGALTIPYQIVGRPGGH